MNNIFTQHPHSIGERYGEHFYFALCFGISLIAAGIACTIHAFLPFLFQKTASRALFKLTLDFNQRMPEKKKNESNSEWIADKN